MLPFESPTALENWLRQHGIDTSYWGIGDSKTAVDLWHEIKEGETILRGHPPERIVRVVQLILRRHNDLLVEIEQELRDGRTRRRRQLPADKMKSGETPQEAAIRCLREELGIAPTQVLSLKKIDQKQSKHESPSYPGLVTQYQFVIFETAVTDLPSGNFWHENNAKAGTDPVKRHLWAWVSGHSVSSK